MKTTSHVEQAFLRPADVCRFLGVGRTKLHLLETNDATFPRKIIITPRCVGWRRADLDQWLETKAEASR